MAKDPSRPFRDKTIWIADDQPAILEITKAILESKGATVLTFDDPFALMTRLEKPYGGKPDLIITDGTFNQSHGSSNHSNLNRIFREGDGAGDTGVTDVTAINYRPSNANSLYLYLVDAVKTHRNPEIKKIPIVIYCGRPIPESDIRNAGGRDAEKTVKHVTKGQSGPNRENPMDHLCRVASELTCQSHEAKL